tara:strand:+ start:37 stop:684 length:648 start_codon:yes stop_codon:yes gene_type:complete
MNNTRFWISWCIGTILLVALPKEEFLLVILLLFLFFIFFFSSLDSTSRKKQTKISSEKKKSLDAEDFWTSDWKERVKQLNSKIIIAKGPEINKITRSVFGNIRYFEINVLNGNLSFATDIGDFSIYNALSKDYESLLGELEAKKKIREYTLANKVSSRTNIDSRSSKSYSRKSRSNSYSRKSRSNNDDYYPTDDDINSVDGGPPSEAYDDDDDDG